MDIIFSKNEITLSFTDEFPPKKKKKMVLSIWIFTGLLLQNIKNNLIEKYNKIPNFKPCNSKNAKEISY